MFDTHCHLNFSIFAGRVRQVIDGARKAGVDYFVVPGTDLETSKKAVEIAQKYSNVYAAVGIHPHHIYQYQILNIKYQKYILNIKNLLKSKRAVAIGEIGLDKHIYQKTKYKNYKVGEQFFSLQKQFFIEQLKLAKKFNKSVILHNREAKDDLLQILREHWHNYFSGRMVFHCCEPDVDLLNFAKAKKIFIGVDGDVTYNKIKQDFVKQIPLNLLVLETDSPFLLPKLSRRRSSHRYNEPKNLPLITKFISKMLNISMNRFIGATTENAKRIFL